MSMNIRRVYMVLLFAVTMAAWSASSAADQLCDNLSDATLTDIKQSVEQQTVLIAEQTNDLLDERDRVHAAIHILDQEIEKNWARRRYDDEKEEGEVIGRINDLLNDKKILEDRIGEMALRMREYRNEAGRLLLCVEAIEKFEEEF